MQEKIKERYNKIHEHFNFKDFLGLSALIFGLLLSNASIQKTTVSATEVVPVKKIKKPVPAVKKSKKAKATKKTLKTPKRKQRVTAARKK